MFAIHTPQPPVIYYQLLIFRKYYSKRSVKVLRLFRKIVLNILKICRLSIAPKLYVLLFSSSFKRILPLRVRVILIFFCIYFLFFFINVGRRF